MTRGRDAGRFVLVLDRPFTEESFARWEFRDSVVLGREESAAARECVFADFAGLEGRACAFLWKWLARNHRGIRFCPVARKRDAPPVAVSRCSHCSFAAHCAQRVREFHSVSRGLTDHRAHGSGIHRQRFPGHYSFGANSRALASSQLIAIQIHARDRFENDATLYSLFVASGLACRW